MSKSRIVAPESPFFSGGGGVLLALGFAVVPLLGREVPLAVLLGVVDRELAVFFFTAGFFGVFVSFILSFPH